MLMLKSREHENDASVSFRGGSIAHRLTICVLLVIIVSSMGVIVAKSRYNQGVRWRIWLDNDDSRAVRPPVTIASLRLAGVRLCRLVLPPAKPAQSPKVKPMATWIVENAGDATYNGTYTESGTYGGYPSYTNGNRWLFHHPYNPQWLLDVTPQEPMPDPPYGSTTDTLPSSWQALEGYTPPPTLTEIDFDPFAIDRRAGSFDPIGIIRPGRATLNDVDYIIFGADQASPRTPEHGFILYDIAARTWSEVELASGGVGNNSTANLHSAIFTAGDGTHVWVTDGVIFASDDTLTFKKFAIVPGVSVTKITEVEIPIASGNISSLLQMADGTLRFMLIDDTPLTGSIQLHSYTLGAASSTVAATYVSGTDLPSGYVAVGYDILSPDDHALHFFDDQLLWLRRAQTSVSPIQRRIFAYTLTDTTCTLLEDELAVSYGLGQTWGTFEGLDGTIMVAELGAAPGTGARYTPGSAGVEVQSIVRAGTIFRSYVGGGTPLVVAGWATSDFVTKCFVYQIAVELAAAPSAIADTTAYTPTVVDVAAELTGLEGVGTGAGDATLVVYPPVEIVAEGIAGSEGDVTLNAGPSLIEAIGSAGGTGAARLVSDTSPVPPDGPGAVADLLLTPGTWPGATRRTALPSYFGRSLNRRFGGTLPGARPTWRTPLDAVNPLYEHAAFWSWCREQLDEPNRLVNAVPAGSHGTLQYVEDDYAVLVSGGTGAGTYDVQESVAQEYITADGLYALQRNANGHWQIVLTAAGTVVQQSVTGSFEAPWDATWPGTLVVTAGDAYTRWSASGLRTIPERTTVYDSHHVRCEVGWPSACTALWDFTSTMRNDTDGDGDTPGILLSTNALGGSIERRYVFWLADLNGITFTVYGSDGSITRYRGTVALPFGARHRVVIATDVAGDTVEAVVNAEPVTMALEAGPSIANVYPYGSVGYSYLWGWGGDPDAGTNGAVGLLHEFGFLSGYAASEAEMRQNQALSFPYGFRASVAQMTDRPV